MSMIWQEPFDVNPSFGKGFIIFGLESGEMAEYPLADKAQQFAIQAHGEQKRKYTGHPYVVHTQAVANTLRGLGYRDEVVAAAHLHDVLEDTPVKKHEIEKHFGADVARLVDEVTDRHQKELTRTPKGTWVDKEGKMVNREARKAMDREHLTKSSPEGASIKLADLLDNHKDINQHDPDFAKVYNSEAKMTLPLLKHGHTGLFLKLKNRLGN